MDLYKRCPTLPKADLGALVTKDRVWSKAPTAPILGSADLAEVGVASTQGRQTLRSNSKGPALAAQQRPPLQIGGAAAPLIAKPFPPSCNTRLRGSKPLSRGQLVAFLVLINPTIRREKIPKVPTWPSRPWEAVVDVELFGRQSPAGPAAYDVAMAIKHSSRGRTPQRGVAGRLLP